jgi:large subunit ribosomal protein L17
MRHRNTKAILNRPVDQRKALVRNLLTNLFEHGTIKTTEAKAKAAAREAEKLISKIKGRPEAHNAIRDLKQVIFTEKASKNALAYATKSSKTSGFTRCTKLGFRAGDNAMLIQVELIQD